MSRATRRAGAGVHEESAAKPAGADSKRPTLPDTYHSHKRTTLLTSAALFLVSLPGVKLASNFYGAIEVGTLGEFLRVGLAATTAYYLVNFVLIWAAEAGPYARAVDRGDADLARVLEGHLHALEMAVKNSDDASRILGDLSRQEAVDTPIAEVGAILNEEAFRRGVAESLEAQFKRDWKSMSALQFSRIGTTSDQDESVRVAVARVEEVWSTLEPPHIEWERFVHSGLLRLEGQHGPLLTNASALKILRQNGMAEVNHQTQALLAVTKEVRNARRALLAAPTSRKFLLSWVDLGAPAAMFVVAMAHFVGCMMKDPPFVDAATLYYMMIR